jgi:hypothetical protein
VATRDRSGGEQLNANQTRENYPRKEAGFIASPGARASHRRAETRSLPTTAHGHRGPSDRTDRTDTGIRFENGPLGSFAFGFLNSLGCPFAGRREMAALALNGRKRKGGCGLTYMPSASLFVFLLFFFDRAL